MKKAPRVARNTRPFTNYKEPAKPICWVCYHLPACLNSTIAWAATALSVYLRYGLMFQLQAPRALIACIRRADASDAQFAVPRRAEPSHCIEFTRELTAKGLFGFQRRLTRVALTLDDPLAFEQALASSFE